MDTVISKPNVHISANDYHVLRIVCDQNSINVVKRLMTLGHLDADAKSYVAQFAVLRGEQDLAQEWMDDEENVTLRLYVRVLSMHSNGSTRSM